MQTAVTLATAANVTRWLPPAGFRDVQVHKAVQSLIKYVGAQQEKATSLFEEDEVFYLQLALKKMPVQVGTQGTWADLPRSRQFCARSGPRLRAGGAMRRAAALLHSLTMGTNVTLLSPLPYPTAPQRQAGAYSTAPPAVLDGGARDLPYRQRHGGWARRERCQEAAGEDGEERRRCKGRVGGPWGPLSWVTGEA